jgi:hypothetical protein
MSIFTGDRCFIVYLSQIDNSMLNSTTSHALKGFSVSTNGASSPLSSTSVQLEDETSIARVRKAIANGSWKGVSDFDGEMKASKHSSTHHSHITDM